MKKRFLTIALLVALLVFPFGLLIGCSCSSNNVIPKDFLNKETYTNAAIDHMNNTLQLTIYIYQEKPDFSKNKFFSKVDEETKELIKTYLTIFKEEINNYDFSSKFDVDLTKISLNDYAYIAVYSDQTKAEFSLYYFNADVNKIYYCYYQA